MIVWLAAFSMLSDSVLSVFLLFFYRLTEAPDHGVTLSQNSHAIACVVSALPYLPLSFSLCLNNSDKGKKGVN